MSDLKYNPDYLCGKPECEANVRGLVAEYQENLTAALDRAKRAEDRALEAEMLVISHEGHIATMDARLSSLESLAREIDGIVSNFDGGETAANLGGTIHELIEAELAADKQGAAPKTCEKCGGVLAAGGIDPLTGKFCSACKGTGIEPTPQEPGKEKSI